MKISKLIVLSGVGRGQVFELKQQKMTCGRSKKCDICIPENAVSSLHCTFYQQDGAFFVVDENSSNGTRVNNIPTTTQTLKYMDILQIGNEELMFSGENISESKIIKTTTGINFKEIKNISTMGNASPFYNKVKGKLQGKVIACVITLMIFIVLGLMGLLSWYVFGKGGV